MEKTEKIRESCGKGIELYGSEVYHVPQIELPIPGTHQYNSEESVV